jgi:spore coat protein U-like protein
MRRFGPALARRAAPALAVAALAFPAGTPAGQSGVLNITATVLSRSNCRFSSNAGMLLNFGSIDPSGTATRTATATKNFSCSGSAPLATFAFTIDNGLFASGGSLRMRNTVVNTEFLPYALSLSPASGTLARNTTQTLTVTGTITSAQYRNAFVGPFSDTVTITLSP